MLVGEVVAGEAGEDLEDAGGGGRGAAAVFGVERDVGRSPAVVMAVRIWRSMRAWTSRAMKWQHSSAFDAGGVVQEHRGDLLGAFELGVAAFQVGLVLVGGEHLGVGEVGVVGDQREAAVGGGVVGDEVVVDGAR